MSGEKHKSEVQLINLLRCYVAIGETRTCLLWINTLFVEGKIRISLLFVLNFEYRDMFAAYCICYSISAFPPLSPLQRIKILSAS